MRKLKFITISASEPYVIGRFAENAKLIQKGPTFKTNKLFWKYMHRMQY